MHVATGWELETRKYGPLVFSHFFRALGDERRALVETRGALRRLRALPPTSDLQIVRWVRGLRPSHGLFVVSSDRRHGALETR